MIHPFMHLIKLIIDASLLEVFTGWLLTGCWQKSNDRVSPLRLLILKTKINYVTSLISSAFSSTPLRALNRYELVTVIDVDTNVDKITSHNTMGTYATTE